MSEQQITMPQLGESVTEGTISKWLVNIGDKIKKYDPIAEVMTDKVNTEIPSSFSGKIKNIAASEGDTLAVGALMCTVELDVPTDSIKPAQPEQQKSNQAEGEVDSQRSMKKRYSPAVLKLSQEHDIDLSRVNGSGKGGRITRKDILNLIEKGQEPPAPTSQDSLVNIQSNTQTLSEETQAKKEDQEANPGDHVIPISGVRKAIAHNMLRSKHEIPHAWTMIEVDVTNLVNYRNTLKNEFKKKEGYNLTYLPFFIKAVVESLKEFPRMNATWTGDNIIEKKDINISLAVASEDALYVPVIQHADEKSIKGIAREVVGLAHKARENKLTNQDMQGGTFTINNTGSFGSIQSQPIINYPQAAILSVESIVKRPVVIDNMIGIRDMVNLCLSIDHRVLDGLVAGHFLARVKERLENISANNTPIY
ncbi:2-oxo acid dehydrogenase subunit E2 [Terrilactibacillus sp. BCM23-1]|uniref:Dihydrolipoamide acetyltransferase component of pyruvate dehydrogenase complex n=1 Tax=Terrilactibacillus tamarindi TaxID=2599694 RepID=A0A6N8CV06_9BACI|nr:dihydrolipoamide acetyltransferase family protein [Terrilactibacillus tamarindi]MTT33063.1 2-oxo acid dehydrogenase subunit E2 [Terrilactibacillus tamarindi]